MQHVNMVNYTVGCQRIPRPLLDRPLTSGPCTGGEVGMRTEWWREVEHNDRRSAGFLNYKYITWWFACMMIHFTHTITLGIYFDVSKNVGLIKKCS